MTPKNAPLNVALIGYGFAGKTLHAPLIRSVPGLALRTVVSGKPEKVKHDLPEVPVAAAPGEVFSDPAVQIVVIATPNDTHFDLARRALAAGKHVVVDKPWTLTVAEALELSKMAEAAGRLISVFHCRRWDADFRTIRSIIASGELGDITYFESHYDRYRPTVMPRWREMPGPGSGIWFDLGAHLADQVLQLFGMPQAIYADLAMQRANAVAVDYFHVLLRYAGTRVILHGSNLVTAPGPRFAVHGTAGSFVKYGMDTQEPALRRGELPGGPGWGDDPQDGTLTTWAGDKPHVRAVRTVPGDYREYYKSILSAVRDGAPNPVTPGEALGVMRILETACRSAESRAELPLVL